MDDDWDLHAVVRGCCTTTAPTATTTTAISTFAQTTSSYHEYFHTGPLPCSSTPLCLEPVNKDVELPDLFKELQDLYKSFSFPKSKPLFLPDPVAVSPPISTFQVAGSSAQIHLKRPHSAESSSVILASNSRCASQPSRAKRRKNQFKSVCQVPADSLSSDIWAWRKYGQKPIKGSPYPRGYYRCSSSKGCLARKQVERNRSDPGMFIVTYTAEHNHPAPTHRNSLAGSTRQKSSSTSVEPSCTASGDKFNPTRRLPSSTSPATSPEEDMPPSTSRGERDDSMDDDEDGQVDLSQMVLNDDFSVGLEGFIDDGQDCFLDRFPANFGLSWNTTMANSTATAAGGS
ncbi:hypothetical protein SAY87_011599 [Trapa incisa]|uniref:WRKY domain-containing protein n=1 Tax=Trapa incisa TaxID=236973 RepID=A0AAN7GZL1_9MYRT|nr:hypothetical protein SAY87_011599 [Trapa incisa]